MISRPTTCKTSNLIQQNTIQILYVINNGRNETHAFIIIKDDDNLVEC